ncbi:hypothetical protein BOX15_Mlig010810g1, partial [Macrostomum lignano]
APSGMLEAQLGRGAGQPQQEHQQQQQSHEDRSRTNLIINYLPQTFDTEDLRALFEKVGPIRTHKVVRDKQTGASLCYGFVDFLFPEHAEKAIGEFHGMRLGNKKLRVAYAATGSSSCAGFVGPDGSPLPLPQMPRAERHSGGGGGGSGGGGGGSGGGALPLRNPGNLYVSGIPRTWTEADLNALFSRFGKLVQIRVLTDPNTGLSKGVGFVTFDDKSNAERAIMNTNGLQGPEWPAPLLVKFAEDGSARARSGPRHAGLSASFNLPLDTGRQRDSAGLGAAAAGGASGCRLSASLCGPSPGLNGSSGFGSGGFGGLSRLLDSDSPTGGGGSGSFGFGGTQAGIEEMVDSLLMFNALGTQNAFRTLTSNGIGGGGGGSGGGGNGGHRLAGHKEITSDLDVSLSSNGSSLDSPPHDALTALSQLGLLCPDLATAAAASAGVPAPLPLHVRTPLIESRPLARAMGIKGCRVWLKLENCQPTGSVCLRGMAHAVRRAAERGFTHVVTSSSCAGNSGLACAYSAARLGLQCTVVLPESAASNANDAAVAQEARARIADEGAQVLLHGADWPEAHSQAELLAGQLGRSVCLLHPFDSEDVWTGYSGLVDELAEALNGEQPDAIVLPVSGGGLLSGVVSGLWRYGWVTTPVIAAELRTTNGGCLDGGGGGGVGRPCQRALDAAREQPLHSVTCSQDEAAKASVSFLCQHQLLTEPVCGAALAAVYGRHVGPGQLARPQSANIVLLVTGGRSVGLQQLFELAGSPLPAALPQQQQQQQQQQQEQKQE